jgi:hypothetical protein
MTFAPVGIAVRGPGSSIVLATRALRPHARLLALALFGAALMSACSDENKFDTNVERYVTIQEGVYGQAWATCDNADGCGEGLPYLIGVDLAVFTSQVSAGKSYTPQATTETAQLGFYELKLGSGTYWICGGSPQADGTFLINVNCGSFILSTTRRLLRADFATGVGGGDWTVL